MLSLIMTLSPRCGVVLYVAASKDDVLSIGAVPEIGKGERVRWRTARLAVGQRLSIIDVSVQGLVGKGL